MFRHYGGNDGSITVEGEGGIPPYLYSLNAGTFQDSGTFSSLEAGTLTVTVQDNNLCTFDVQVIITQPVPPLTGNNYFTNRRKLSWSFHRKCYSRRFKQSGSI